MFAQVVRVRFRPGKAGEGTAIFEGSVIPAARQQKGFKQAYLLLDRSANTGIGFSIWENEADVTAWQRAGFTRSRSRSSEPCSPLRRSVKSTR